jgi:sugar transferase (PEP-CTERM/EpsH1 system associated)
MNGDEVGRGRVLMLTHRVPYPLDRGDRIRAFHILEHLAKRVEVCLACASDEPVGQEQRRVLSELVGGEERLAIRRIHGGYSKVRGLAGLMVGKAVTPTYFYRRDLAKVIGKWHGDRPFDAVFTYCTGMIGYARALMKEIDRARVGARLPRQVIDLVDVDSVKWADYAEQSARPMRWVYQTESKRLREIEAGKRDAFERIFLVSDAEVKTYREHVGERRGLTTLRHAVDGEYFSALEDCDAQTLVFVGTLNYRPNCEGIVWFAQQVMPVLRRRRPEARLMIVGRHPTAQVKALDGREGVEVVGSVADVREYLRKASVVVAPLRLARGVQSKVLEAMASARAVVCSPAAAEGIVAQEGEHLLVADRPEQWVEKIDMLMSDGRKRRAIAAAARKQIEKVYPWEKCLESLEAMVLGEARVEEVKMNAGDARRMAA